MAATVRINEYNGAGATETAGITNCNMGSADSVNLDPVANSIVAGANSYEKWQKFEVTAMGGSSKIDNLRVWRSGALGANATHLTNARTSSYGGAASFTTPTASSSAVATQTMPSSDPGATNLGIGGSLSGSLAATGKSDYLVHQIQTTGSATAGSTSTMTYQYDETT